MLNFRDKLVNYLIEERDWYDEEIRAHKELDDDSKVAAGLLIRDCSVDPASGTATAGETRFNFDENNTKTRMGDTVSVSPAGSGAPGKLHQVLEVATDYMVLDTAATCYSTTGKWDIEVFEVSMFDTYISILQDLDQYSPGAFFLKILGDLESPRPASMFGPDPAMKALAPSRTAGLNAMQDLAVRRVIEEPSIHLIQGPPGTGKTHVLSCIADIFSESGKEVAILAKTHQAVNNALNKIKSMYPSLTVVKIGQELKSDGLDPGVLNFASYRDYLKWRKTQKHKRSSDIVGMTLQAATTNLCIRNGGFKPLLVLVDEASQIPLAEASVIGTCCAGTIVFIGDDRQMPPIFAPDQEADTLSVSVFEHLATLYPAFRTVLDTTFRMNSDICSFVSKRFYEPYGIHLSSGAAVSGRTLEIDMPEETDERIVRIFAPGSPSILTFNVSRDMFHEEKNPEEALFAAQVAVQAMKHGVPARDIAIVTPFRKQVNEIRGFFRAMGWAAADCPLVDTVERLQGQDVEMVILSFSVTSEPYYRSLVTFLENPNRLNVMVSRAKSKVVLLKADFIRI